MIKIEQRAPQETESTPSKMELVLLRHGQAESQDKNAALSKEGIAQATDAAKNLMERIAAAGGGIIKIVTSPVRRARETGDVVKKTIQTLLSDDRFREIRLLESLANQRNQLQAAGLMPRLQELDRANPVQYWLEHSNVVAGKTPDDFANQLTKMIETLQRVATKINSKQRVYYVAVTHEIPQAGFINALTGKTFKDIGGPIKNCETITVDITGVPGISPTFSFRDTNGIVPLES